MVTCPPGSSEILEVISNRPVLGSHWGVWVGPGGSPAQELFNDSGGGSTPQTGLMAGVLSFPREAVHVALFLDTCPLQQGVVVHACSPTILGG